MVMQIASLRRRVPIAFVRLLSSDFSAAVQLFGDRHRPRLADQRRRPSGECRNRSGSPHSSGGLASGSLPPRLLQSLSTRHPNCPYGSAIRSRKRYFSLYLCPLYHSHSLHSSLPPSLPPSFLLHRNVFTIECRLVINTSCKAASGADGCGGRRGNSWRRGVS